MKNLNLEHRGLFRHILMILQLTKYFPNPLHVFPRMVQSYTLECNYNFFNIIYALPLPRNVMQILCNFLKILGLILQSSLYAQNFTNQFHTFLRMVQSYTIEFNQIFCSNVL
jgi:hypothetical protein